MKMLSVSHRMVENKGRTVIRVSEWFLWMSAEQEKGKSKAAPFGKADPKGCATQDRLNRAKGAPPAQAQFRCGGELCSAQGADLRANSSVMTFPRSFHFGSR
jgi:hypothetical protein